MNPNSISHRLFIAALSPGGPPAGKRPVAVRAALAPEATKIKPAKSASSFSALASRRVAVWSWSGWSQSAV